MSKKLVFLFLALALVLACVPVLAEDGIIVRISVKARSNAMLFFLILELLSDFYSVYDTTVLQILQEICFFTASYLPVPEETVSYPLRRHTQSDFHPLPSHDGME